MLLNIVSGKKSGRKPAAKSASIHSEGGGKKSGGSRRKLSAKKRPRGPQHSKASHTSSKPARVKDSELAATSFIPEDEDGEDVVDGAASTSRKLGETERRIVRTHNARQFDRSMFAQETSSFLSLGLAPRLVEALQAELDHHRPTKIQAKAIPVAMAGKDVMFKSRTGSGKTLAFLLPMVHKLQGRRTRLKRTDGTRCIIIAPTRELALQINHVLGIVTKPFHWLVSTAIMGGERKKSEKARLRKGASIVVATPGRLLDHMMTTRAFDVRRVEILVLDEADRLLDLGFEKDLKSIIELLKTRQELPGDDRQTILTSATLSTGVLGLAKMSLKDPVRIGIDGDGDGDGLGGDAAAAGGLRLHQHYIKADSKYRVTVLAAFLRSVFRRGRGGSGARKAIVFVSTCDSVEFHHRLLRRCSWPPDGARRPRRAWLPKSVAVFKLHGNVPQRDRTRTFFRFCNAEEGILFSTDVAARGLDLPAVDYIIQYDPPDDTSTYVHRVGRTARMGQRGQAVIFLQKSELEYVEVLKENGVSLTEINVVKVLAELNPDPEDLERTQGSDGDENEDEDDAPDKVPPGLQLQHQFEALVASDVELHELARLSFLSSIRAYGAYPRSMKAIFHPRKLHLGYVAKSFGLREPPKRLARDIIPGKSVHKQKQNKRNSKRSDGKLQSEEDRQTKMRKELLKKNPINRKKLERKHGDELRSAQKRKKFSGFGGKRSEGRTVRSHNNAGVGGERGAGKKRTKFGHIDALSEFAS